MLIRNYELYRPADGTAQVFCCIGRVIAASYIVYNMEAHKFEMTEAQALILVNEEGPAFLPGAFELACGSLAAIPRITELFRSGAGTIVERV